MRIKYLMALAGLSVALAAPMQSVHAQSIKKIGDKAHHELKKAGNAVKESAGEVSSKTHNELTKAGNATKTEAGKVTGIHKIGGDVGKGARKISHASKKAGRSAKKDLHKSTSSAHNDLTKAGKKTKAAIKP
ncbi:MAG TPA: hypothetical protein VGM50_16905 [Gemmatimonadaceae bacterium]|jgi:hypothetical protein